jgi:hypothetical protein
MPNGAKREKIMSSSVLKGVDGLQLDPQRRALFRPGEPIQGQDGIVHHLPRFFFEVPTWPAAREMRISAHFKLAEVMTVDCREAELLLKQFPHYVPCAILVLARYLESFRAEVNAPVFISANGGYRSPAHRLSSATSRHHWGTAADIYRVGDTYLDDERAIERYRQIATDLGQEIMVRPYTAGDDHLHLDLGFVTLVPADCSEAV